MQLMWQIEVLSAVRITTRLYFPTFRLLNWKVLMEKQFQKCFQAENVLYVSAFEFFMLYLN